MFIVTVFMWISAPWLISVFSIQKRCDFQLKDKIQILNAVKYRQILNVLWTFVSSEYSKIKLSCGNKKVHECIIVNS